MTYLHDKEIIKEYVNKEIDELADENNLLKKLLTTIVSNCKNVDHFVFLKEYIEEVDVLPLQYYIDINNNWIVKCTPVPNVNQIGNQ